MDKNEAKEYLSTGWQFLKLTVRYGIACWLRYWSRLISKIYKSLCKKSVNKPKLFKFFSHRWCKWIYRANHYFDVCDEVKLRLADLKM